MKDDRLHIPVKSDYLQAIGMAVFAFTRAEWAAVYCGEKLTAGYVGTVAKKTAGTIANEVAAMSALVLDAVVRQRFIGASAEFVRLTKRRNDLLHANPATVSNEQRLVRHGTPWQISDLEDLADEFSANGIELNDLYHNHL